MGQDWSREARGGTELTKKMEEAAGVRCRGAVVAQVSALGGRFP